MDNRVIALSAGHSDSDPGAIYNGLVERDLVEIIVKDASTILRSHGIGVLNPPSSLSLTQTIAWINAREDQIDICTEIHINSSSKPNQGVGLEGWYYRSSEESKRFAQFLVDAIAVESGMKKDRGVKDEYYVNIWHRLGFVHNTIPLACLIECGFINTDEDRKILSDKNGLYNISKGIARGILSYWGMEWKPNQPPEPTYSAELTQLQTSLAECQADCLQLKGRLEQIAVLSKL